MALRFPVLTVVILLAIAAPARAEQGLRPAAQPGSVPFAPSPAAGNLAPGRWDWPGPGSWQAHDRDAMSWRPSAPAGTRFSIGLASAAGLLQRFLPPSADELAAGWRVRFSLRNDSSTLLPRVEALSMQRDFGAQRFTYSLYSGYRGPLAGPVPIQAESSGYRLEWSRSLGESSSIGLSYASAGLYDEADSQAYPNYRLYGQYETRNLTLHGRYGFAPGWSLNAQATAYGSGNPAGSLGLRLDVRRGF